MWGAKEHGINALLWATTGAFFAVPYLQNNPSMMPVGLAVVGAVYSYATDYIADKF
jgi:hypothetical protein